MPRMPTRSPTSSTRALGLGDVAADQERVPWALRRLLETVADTGPLVLILEDAHAAEPRADRPARVPRRVADDGAAVRALPRPPGVPRRAAAAWIGGRAGVAAISLAPLGGDDAARLLEHLVDERSAPLSRRADVLDAAEGNPLFIEQMFAMRSEDDGATASSGSRPRSRRWSPRGWTGSGTASGR